MLYIALVEATNLIAGYTGYYNFGIATFFGIGAYSAALCINSLGITLGIPVGLLSGAAFSGF
jgi:branched-chain amino acid transport system permease protein